MNDQQPTTVETAEAKPGCAPAPGSASPKPIEFEVCRQVLLWLRDHSGLDEAWHHPITEIAGVVRGYKAIAESPEPTREGWIRRVCGSGKKFL